MSFSVNLMRRLDILEPPLKEILWTILDEIEQHREASVTKTEFNELKEIVRELGQTTQALVKAQDRTEQRLINLAEAQERTDQRLAETKNHIDQRLAEIQARTDQSLASLAEAQNRTDQRLAETQARTDQGLASLAKAQERTDQRLAQTQEELAQAQTRVIKAIEELTQAQKQTEQEVAELSRSLKATRSQIGGLAKSVSYALENEAYRKLPAYLKTHYQLEITEQFIRTVIGKEEINLFAKATRHTETLLVVGEAVMKLDDRAKMEQLEKNVQVVAAQFHQPILPLIVTHFAHPTMLEKAREQGVIVVQSFEWG